MEINQLLTKSGVELKDNNVCMNKSWIFKVLVICVYPLFAKLVLASHVQAMYILVKNVHESHLRYIKVYNHPYTLRQQ